MIHTQRFVCSVFSNQCNPNPKFWSKQNVNTQNLDSFNSFYHHLFEMPWHEKVYFSQTSKYISNLKYFRLFTLFSTFPTEMREILVSTCYFKIRCKKFSEPNWYSKEKTQSFTPLIWKWVLSSHKIIKCGKIFDHQYEIQPIW